MTEQAINKKKFKIDVQTFITIMVFVFWLWWSSALITYKLNEVIANQVVLREWQEEIMTKRDEQHKDIDSKLWYIMPTIRLLAIRFDLPVYWP
jgi:hypothetical protein